MLQAFAIGGDEQSLNPEARRVMMELVGKVTKPYRQAFVFDVVRNFFFTGDECKRGLSTSLIHL